MLDKAPRLAFAVAGHCRLGRNGNCKLLDQLFRAISVEIIWSVRHAVPKVEGTLDGEVVPPIAGPLVVYLEEPFLYVGADLWRKALTTEC